MSKVKYKRFAYFNWKWKNRNDFPGTPSECPHERTEKDIPRLLVMAKLTLRYRIYWILYARFTMLRNNKIEQKTFIRCPSVGCFDFVTQPLLCSTWQNVKWFVLAKTITTSKSKSYGIMQRNEKRKKKAATELTAPPIFANNKTDKDCS